MPSPGEESKQIKVSPSIMCVDLCRLEQSIRRLESCNVDFLHIDIMDAHFVPNMPIGLEQLRQIRPRTRLPFDVHLMVENNEFFIQEMAGIGVQQLCVHTESASHLDRLLSMIRDYGILAGVALNPATPLLALDYILERLDFVTIMTVNPGFAGQKLVPGAFRKISDCRKYLNARGLEIPIEVDGNVSFQNIPQMVAAGADILVAGSSSMFDPGGSLAKNLKRLRKSIEQGLRLRKRQDGG